MTLEAPKPVDTTVEATPAAAPDAAGKAALKSVETVRGQYVKLAEDVEAGQKPAAPTVKTEEPGEPATTPASTKTPESKEEPTLEEQSFSDSLTTFYNTIKMGGGGTFKAVLATVAYAFSVGPTKLWNFLKKSFDGENEKEEKSEASSPEKPANTPGKTLLENIQSLLKEFKITETADAKKNYFLVAVELAKEVEAKYGVPYQVCVAQSCLETGFGTSNLIARSFNAFGLVKNGSYMKFGSLRESFMAYGDRLATHKIYKAAFNYKDDPLRFLEEVKKAGYAEDPNYVSKVRGVASSYGLKF